MNENTIYADIAKRTGGDIYIGVVGPVRTGKSTFIRKFLDSVVLPNIDNEYDRQRTEDEIPQSASGKTVMTTEPKFVPDESVKIKTPDGTELNVKMVDCVGYMVGGALGGEEGGESRMVMTPWSEEEMPFARAAEIGTEKVIREHSTIAILVTTDGSITGIEREAYVPAEERIVAELKESGKPFAIILNSKNPSSEVAHELAHSLEEKYSAPVALVSCPDINRDDIREILSLILGEFPIRAMTFDMPTWCAALPEDHPLRRENMEKISAFADRVRKFGDVERALPDFPDISLDVMNAADGTAKFDLPLARQVYYQTLGEMAGIPIADEREMFDTVVELSKIREKYMKVESALKSVEEKGYGIVMPSATDLRLDEPRLVKQQGGYGVKVSAVADSIHMIRTGIKTELCPVIGSEEQTAEVVKYLSDEMRDNPTHVWEYNMFGKTLYEHLRDGMTAKLSHMPDDSREKLGETLGKIINEGASGLICILI
jgi:stage IV sporulation protein A